MFTRGPKTSAWMLARPKSVWMLACVRAYVRACECARVRASTVLPRPLLKPERLRILGRGL
eukprot:10109272-Alexandrium_andersonii.AAC.1